MCRVSNVRTRAVAMGKEALVVIAVIFLKLDTLTILFPEIN
jgi:hypothetical protein